MFCGFPIFQNLALPARKVRHLFAPGTCLESDTLPARPLTYPSVNHVAFRHPPGPGPHLQSHCREPQIVTWDRVCSGLRLKKAISRVFA